MEPRTADVLLETARGRLVARLRVMWPAPQELDYSGRVWTLRHIRDTGEAVYRTAQAGFVGPSRLAAGQLEIRRQAIAERAVALRASRRLGEGLSLARNLP